MLNLAAIRIDGGTQSRQELNQATVDAYSESMLEGAKFPPVTVYFDGVDYWLGDGFHRLFGAKKAGFTVIDADVRNGTKRDAKVCSWGANDKHGLPRSNVDKRKIVAEILNDEEGGDWSDREIAKRFGFSHPFVGNVRRSLETITSEKAAERTYTTKHGTTAVMNTAKIGKAQPVAKPQTVAQAVQKKPAPVVEVEPEAEAPPDYTELDAAYDQINELQADLVVARMGDVPEEQKAQAAERIADLQAEVNTLRATLAAVQLSRDSLMEERAQMMRQMKAQRAEIERLKSSK